jgi:hypothetical protein
MAIWASLLSRSENTLDPQRILLEHTEQSRITDADQARHRSQVREVSLGIDGGEIGAEQQLGQAGPEKWAYQRQNEDERSIEQEPIIGMSREPEDVVSLLGRASERVAEMGKYDQRADITDFLLG